MDSTASTTTAASAALLRVRSDMERVWRLGDQLNEARDQLDEAHDDFGASVTLAGDVGVPVAEIARHVGLSRERVYLAIERHKIRQDAGLV